MVSPEKHFFHWMLCVKKSRFKRRQDYGIDNGVWNITQKKIQTVEIQYFQSILCISNVLIFTISIWKCLDCSTIHRLLLTRGQTLSHCVSFFPTVTQRRQMRDLFFPSSPLYVQKNKTTQKLKWNKWQQCHKYDYVDFNFFQKISSSSLAKLTTSVEEWSQKKFKNEGVTSLW